MNDPTPTPVAAAAAACFDPLGFEDVPTATVRIKDPVTGAPTSMVITLAGPEHPDRKRRLHARQRRMRAAFAKNAGKLPVTDPEDEAAEQLDELVASTLGWAGSSLPYSADAARQLYADPKRRWLCDQVQAALDERELFTRSSAAA